MANTPYFGISNRFENSFQDMAARIRGCTGKEYSHRRVADRVLQAGLAIYTMPA